LVFPTTNALCSLALPGGNITSSLSVAGVGKICPTVTPWEGSVAVGGSSGQMAQHQDRLGEREIA